MDTSDADGEASSSSSQRPSVCCAMAPMLSSTRAAFASPMASRNVTRGRAVPLWRLAKKWRDCQTRFALRSARWTMPPSGASL